MIGRLSAHGRLSSMPEDYQKPSHDQASAECFDVCVLDVPHPLRPSSVHDCASSSRSGQVRQPLEERSLVGCSLPVSGKIFISYRRDDSSASAGRLYDRLITHFPSNQIFMDVDNLDPGVDFVKAIEESVGSCDVLIAVIGRRWLISSDEEGRRRLDNSEDFVRIEIATALKRGIRVIPGLVEGVSMPRSGDLPDDLKSLLRRQALEVSHTRFRADSERLIGAVERALEQAKAEQRQREEKERLEAERREREEKERFDALRRESEEKERLEAERPKREEKQRLAEQRERDEKERLEVERRQREENDRLKG